MRISDLSSDVCSSDLIFGAIDSIVAHNDGYSPRCSCTIRTARSRTSGENLFCFFIAPFSQRLEPPQNPGRFTVASEVRQTSIIEGPVHTLGQHSHRSEEHTSELQ